MQLTVNGAGHQEWLLDLPRQGVFADIAKEIPNAKQFYLRPDVGGKDNLSIPMDLPLNDLRLYLADGYHVYAEGEQISSLKSRRSLPDCQSDSSRCPHRETANSSPPHVLIHTAEIVGQFISAFVAGLLGLAAYCFIPPHNSTLSLYLHLILFVRHPLVQQCLAVRHDHTVLNLLWF